MYCFSRDCHKIKCFDVLIVQNKGGGWGKGEEMTQTLYAHMNKRN
jgi:hypothetical protein